MKRIISLLLCCVMLCAAAAPAAFAEAESVALLNETFNDTITRGVPNNAIVFGDGSLVQVLPGERKKILRVRNQWETTLVHFGFNMGSNNNIVVETKLKLDDLYSQKDLLQYANTSARYTIVSCTTSGALYDMGGDNIGKIRPGEWIKLTAVMNMETLRYELYVNDRLATHRGMLTEAGEIVKVGFTSSANQNKETSMECEYFRVYTGSAKLAEDYFPFAAMNKNEKSSKAEHASKPKYKPSLIFDMDCQSQAVGTGIGGVPVWQGQAYVVEDEQNKENKVFRLHYQKGSGSVMGMYSQVESYPSMVVQMDLRVDSRSSIAWRVVCRDKPANSNDLQIYSINQAGKLVGLDGTTILSDKKLTDGWVNVAGVIDFRTQEVRYYIDGEYAKTISYASDPLNTMANKLSSNVYEVRVLFTTSGATGDHYLDMDNVLFYKSIDPVEKSVLMGEGAVMSESDTLDYTIDPSPITPDMSAFRRVSDSLSVQKNPSTLLTDYSKPKDTYKDAVCVVADSSNVWVKDGKYNSDYKFRWDGAHMIAPAPTLAAIVNSPLEFDSATGVAKIGNVTAKVGDKFITVGDKQYDSESEVQMRDGILYLPLGEFVRYGMNKFYGESSKGFAVIATEKKPYHFNINPGGQSLLNSVDDYSHMMAYLILDRYNADTIMQLFNEKVKNKPYPRVQTIARDAETIKAGVETDPRMKEFSDLTLSDAKNMLNRKLNIPDVPGVQINGLPSILEPPTMWYAYYMTGDRAYIDKVKEDAKYLLNLEFWNPKEHMLSTSCICLFLAYTYDLFRDELTQEERDNIVNACTSKAIKYHNDYMYGAGWNNWPVADYNWNVICNTGPLLASLIFLGEGYNDDLYLDTIEKAQVSLGYFMQYFAPDGGGWESPGYTNFLLSYMVPMMDGVEEYFGDSLGLTEYPGTDKIGSFLVNSTGAKSNWAIHCDTDTVPACTALSMWFTKRFHDYAGQKLNVEQLYKNMPQYQINGYSMMKNYMPNPPDTGYPDYLDIIYRGLQMGASRDAWGEGEQTFMGVHGGYNNDAGMQVDCGNFIFEANGKLFADDTGREDYAVQGSAYPLRPEGHNLWVVNPDEGIGQNKIACGVVKQIESKPKGVIYTVDLLPAYYGMVDAAKRGYMLSDDRKIFTVQDEIKPMEGSNEFYWFWHSPSDIEIDEENKMVTLTQDDKKCMVYFDSNVDFIITKQDKLESLPRSPKPAGQLQSAQAKKQKKVVINFFSEGEPITFRAVAVPFGQKWERTPLSPIDEWTIPDGSTTEGYSTTDMIYINGKPVEGFKSNIYDYTMYYPRYYGDPVITADTDGEIVEVINRTENNKTVAVRIASKEHPENIRTYTVTLQSDACVGLPEGGERIPIAYATASGSDGNLPAGAIDDDMTTRWSAPDDANIVFDLGMQQEFNTLAMYIYGSDNRRMKYEIWVSDDNEEYRLISDNLRTSGTLDDWEHTQFTPVKARYVKLTCHGSDIIGYNSLVEARIYNVPIE